MGDTHYVMPVFATYGEKPLVIFDVSFDYTRHILNVHPRRASDRDWLRVNNEFALAAMRLIYAEYQHADITRQTNDPTLIGITNRFCDVLRAAYPHTDFSAIIQLPARGDCHC